MATAVATAPEKQLPTGIPPSAVDIGKGFLVLPDTPLPALSGAGTPAFKCVMGSQPARPLYALVCGVECAPRLDLLTLFQSLDYPIMVTLVDFAIAHWPPAKGERLMLVFEQPPGAPVMPTLSSTFKSWSDDRIVEGIIRPVYHMLKDMSTNGLTHGWLSTQSLFASAGSGTSAMFLECLSSPPGLNQSTLFETLDRGQTEPISRGPADISDDLYALGVVCALLTLGGNPLAGKTEEQVLQIKSDQGSYPALFRGIRVHSGLVEVLRGLMQDGKTSRWNLRELDLWLSGRRLSPKQPDIPIRASRPYKFMNRDLWTVRSLSRGFSQNEFAAYREISGGHLDLWLRRAASAPRTAEKVDEAIKAVSTRGRGANFESHLTCRVLMVLDPGGPIRYRDAKVMPGGIGFKLASSLVNEEPVDALIEILSLHLPGTWYNYAPTDKNEGVTLLRDLERARSAIEKDLVGFGVERALYYLNPHSPCYSKILEGYFVFTLRRMILALEALAGRSPPPDTLMDRHIAAFIGAREKQAEEWIFKELSSKDDQKRIIATVRLITIISRHHPTQKLPNLCRWCANLAKPILEGYRNQITRKRVQEVVEEAIAEGDLPKLFAQISDKAPLVFDNAEFARAQRGFAILNNELVRLEEELANPRGVTRDYGRYYAAITSMFLSVVGGGIIILAMGIFG